MVWQRRVDKFFEIWRLEVTFNSTGKTTLIIVRLTLSLLVFLFFVSCQQKKNRALQEGEVILDRGARSPEGSIKVRYLNHDTQRIFIFSGKCEHGDLFSGRAEERDDFSSSYRKVVRFRDGLRDGKEETFSNRKLDSQITYKKGRRDGATFLFGHHGDVDQEFYYKEGLLNGESKTLWPNKVVKNYETYEDGKLVGESVSKYYTGVVSEKKVYKNCKIDGDWLFYSENGDLQEKRQFCDGVPCGKWYRYENSKEIAISKKYEESVANWPHSMDVANPCKGMPKFMLSREGKELRPLTCTEIRKESIDSL